MNRNRGGGGANTRRHVIARLVPAAATGGPGRVLRGVAVVSLALLSVTSVAACGSAGLSVPTSPPLPATSSTARPAPTGAPPTGAPTTGAATAAATPTANSDSASPTGSTGAPVSSPPVTLAAAPTPAAVLAALRASGVKLVVEEGWDQQWDLPSRQADWHPVGVMLHHTGAAVEGNAPSREFLLNFDQPLELTRYDGLTGGSRGANLLIGRDGTVYLMRTTRGPHAGTGGPMTLGTDVVPADNGNGRFYGIEIESAGTSDEIHPTADFIDGFGAQQVDATARVSAALLTLLGRGVDHVVDHKAYAPGRKVDLYGSMLDTFKSRIAPYVELDSRSSGTGS